MLPNRRILLAYQLPEALHDVLEGVTTYVKQAQCRWQVLLCATPHDFRGAFVRHFADGAITGLGPGSRGIIERLRRTPIPVVNVIRDLHPLLPSVLSDNAAIGRAGAAYLLRRGFRHFGFVGIETPWSKQRGAGFAEALAARGLAPVHAALHLTDFEYASKVRATQFLRRWLRTLPRKIAVMGASDFIARTLLLACEAQGVAVPGEVAVLGVDNFASECQLAQMPLSSVAQDFVRIGFEGAALLDRLITNPRGAKPKAPLLVPPGRLHVRTSTDVLAFEDPVVVAALGVIHEHAATGISMKELLARVPLSRKWLDHRFKQIVGHTPSEEIRRCRLQCVCDLLTDTDMPLRQIAARGRYSCVQNLIRCFRFAHGMSPQAYRRQSRAMASSAALAPQRH